MAFDKGADPEELDRSAGRMRDFAQELSEIETAATGVVSVLGTHWQGHDVESASQSLPVQRRSGAPAGGHDARVLCR